MLLGVKRLDGKTVQLHSETVFRVRPAIDSMEPGAITVVHYDRDTRDRRYDTLASRQTIEDVVAELRTALPMVELTSPSNTVVFLDAGKIQFVDPPVAGLHYKGTKAVITILGQTQQLAESPSEVQRIVNEALRSFAPA